jgi:hypothetical protein
VAAVNVLPVAAVKAAGRAVIDVVLRARVAVKAAARVLLVQAARVVDRAVNIVIVTLADTVKPEPAAAAGAVVAVNAASMPATQARTVSTNSAIRIHAVVAVNRANSTAVGHTRKAVIPNVTAEDTAVEIRAVTRTVTAVARNMVVEAELSARRPLRSLRVKRASARRSAASSKNSSADNSFAAFHHGARCPDLGLEA